MRTSRRIPASSLLLFALLSAALPSCGSSDETTQPGGQQPTEHPSATDTIGPEGGVVEVDGVKLVIPPGALSEPTELSVKQRTDGAPGEYEAFSPVFEFGPDGLVFAVPAEVEFAFEGDAARAKVFWSTSTGGYESLGGTVSGSRISAEVTHFSTGFVGAAVEQSGNDAGIPEDALAACAFIQLCGFSTFPEGLSGNVPGCVEKVIDTRMQRASLSPAKVNFIETIAACGLSSSTCEDFRLCVHGGTLRTCSGPNDDRCDGQVAVDCRHSSDAFPTLQFCEEVGSTCDYQSCKDATEPQPEACDPTTTSAHCDGETLVFCNGALETLVRMDCAAAGKVCTPTGCQGEAPVECEEPPAEWGGSCDGDEAVLCVLNRRVRIPCSAVGRSKCEKPSSLAICPE